MAEFPLTGGCNCGSGGGEKWFCGDCGSSIFRRNLSHPDAIGIRMGTFDTDPGIRPSIRTFVADAAPWEALPDDGLPRHPQSVVASAAGQRRIRTFAVAWAACPILSIAVSVAL